MQTIPEVTLHDATRIPIVGLGVLRIDNDEVSQVVENAIEAGYRHIDGAAGYENEQGVGRGIAQAGFANSEARKALWVTTKVKDSEQGYDSVLRAFDRQIQLLGLDYVDMYMIHWPTPFNWRADQTWRAMRKLREEGRIRTIGVCNFLPEHLDRLYEEVGEYPTVNQIELHPTWQQREVVAYCKAHNIAVEAYSPMARGADLHAGNGLIERLAEKYQVSVAQIILRWHIEHGTIIIPKSVHTERQRENLNIFDFSLSPEDIAAIDALDSPTRAGHDPLTFTYA